MKTKQERFSLIEEHIRSFLKNNLIKPPNIIRLKKLMDEDKTLSDKMMGNMLLMLASPPWVHVTKGLYAQLEHDLDIQSSQKTLWNIFKKEDKCAEKYLLNLYRYNTAQLPLDLLSDEKVRHYFYKHPDILIQLFKLFPPELSQKTSDLIREINGLSTESNYAIHILNKARILNHDTYQWVTKYETQRHLYIFAATGLWVAHEIKNLYLDKRLNELPGTLQQILEDLNDLDRSFDIDGYPTEWNQFFTLIQLLCEKKLCERDDYLTIVQSVLDARINQPFEYETFDIVLECCHFVNADTKDIANIMDVMSIDKHRSGFAKLSKLEDKNKPEYFNMFLEAVSLKKMQLSESNTSRNKKQDAMFFFKQKADKYKGFDKKDFIQQVLSTDPANYNPKQFSFDNDKPKPEDYGSKSADVKFGFE